MNRGERQGYVASLDNVGWTGNVWSGLGRDWMSGGPAQEGLRLFHA
jgi:hypothetical protein